MRGGAAVVGAVAEDGAVEVREDVDVWGAAGVVTGEEGGELGDSVVLGGLEATEEGGVEVGGVGGVAVSGGDDAGVDAGGVAVFGMLAGWLRVGGDGGRTPEIDHAVYNGLAGGHVDDLDVDDHLDTLLVFNQVAADVLSAGVVWALGDLRAEDAGVIAGEDGGLRGEGRVVDIGMMGGVQNGSSVSCTEVGGVYTIVSSESLEEDTLYSLVESPLFSRVLFAMAARL